jgi:hypothetical protein
MESKDKFNQVFITAENAEIRGKTVPLNCPLEHSETEQKGPVLLRLVATPRKPPTFYDPEAKFGAKKLYYFSFLPRFPHFPGYNLMYDKSDDRRCKWLLS